MSKINQIQLNSRWLWVCRIAVGGLFIFSGLIKINDPIGFSYKLEEYFEVFHLGFLNGASLLIAVSLCVMEIIFGFALLIGAYSVKVAWGLLLLVVFFGFLTFYSAYFKVVQTCGCFGDAIPLSPWQSFSKDMFLLLLELVVFFKRKTITPLYKDETTSTLLIGAISIALIIGLYTYNFLPIFDFLPYKIGANILDEMKTPAGAKPDEYEITYHLKNIKTKEEKVMNDKDYLKTGIWKDTNWHVVGNTESKLIKRGFTPAIRDLQINDAQRNDYTQELLGNPYNNLVIVAYQLNNANADAIDRLNTTAINLYQNYHTRTILLTSTPVKEAEAFSKKHHLIAEIFYADEVPLKTMIRANPGVFLLKNGTILNKWHYHSLPDYDALVKKYFQQ